MNHPVSISIAHKDKPSEFLQGRHVMTTTQMNENKEEMTMMAIFQLSDGAVLTIFTDRETDTK